MVIPLGKKEKHEKRSIPRYYSIILFSGNDGGCIMTRFDYQAFVVALIVCLLLLGLFSAFVYLHWAWYVMQMFTTIFVGVYVLIVLVIFSIAVLIWEELKFRRKIYQIRLDKKQAKIDLYKAKASLKMAKGKAVTQYAIPVGSGDGVYTNLNLTGHHIPALPQPTEAPTELRAWDNTTCHSEWFHQAINALHLIVIGESGSGKSTLVGAVAYRRAMGGQVRVIDPHGRAKDWGDLPIVGNGRDYKAINQYFGQVLVEMTWRYELYDRGQDQFEPLTIIVDELTSVADKCDQWTGFFKDVSCEGRKVKIRLIVLIHGKGVKTLNLEGQGDLRHNLQFIYLGKHAVKVNNEAAKMTRPACMDLNGENRLIDTSQLLNIVPPKPVRVASRKVLEDFDPKPQTDKQNDLDNVLNQFEGREKEVAKCILQGLSKTKTRKTVTGDNTTLGRMYDDVKLRLHGRVTG